MDAPGTVLQEYLTRPWQEDFVLGRGADFITGRQMASALTPDPPVTQSEASEKTTRMCFIRTEEDFRQEVGVSLSGSGNVDGVTVKGSADYLDKVRFSSVSSTLLASYVERQADFDRLSAPTLSEEAKARIGDVAKFRSVYGDYYLSGGLRQAEFNAVYVLRASDESQLDAFHTSVAASAPEIFSAGASAEFVREAQSHSIEIDVYIAMSATSGTPPEPDGKEAGSYTPGAVLKTLEWFQQHSDMGYLVAELTHYSALDPDFSRAIDVPPSFFTNLNDLDEGLAEVRRLYDAAPSTYQADVKKQLDDLSIEVENTRPQFEHQPDLMNGLLATADGLRAGLAPIVEFFDRVRASASNDGGYSRIVPAGGSAGIGRNGDATPIPAEVFVQSTSLEWSEDATSGCLTGSVPWNRPGARVVSVDVGSGWPATERGTVTKYGGGVGADHVYVEFEGDFDRGMHWVVDLRFVDCDATT